ncbi:hypothetical protein FRB96_001293 [Tulasnella sp. 330]|nr:hypothetical protein FRB96_001293 [Tulasnella sp. 330]
MAQTTINTVFMNDTRLVYSGDGANPGVGWGDPGLNPVTYNNNTCSGGVKATTVQGASVTLIFTGTAVTINFLLDHVGSTAQVLLDGALIQEENTNNAAAFYYDCELSPVSSNNLPNTSHNVTVVKDVAVNYMYMHSIVFTAAPIIPTSTAASSTAAPSSTSATPTASAPASTSGSSKSSLSSHSSHGAAIGGAIGAVAILLIVGIIALLYRRHSRRRRVARRNSLGPDGRIHAPDPIFPVSMPRNQSQRKSIDLVVKDDLVTSTLDGPLAGPYRSSMLTANPSSRPPAEVLEMSSFIRESQASELSLGVARQDPGKSRPGRQDANSSGLPPGAAAPSSLLPVSSSSSSTNRPLPPPPRSTSQTPLWTSDAAVIGGLPAASSGRADAPLPPQLEFIQSLVNRGLDNSAISNVISMMATSAPSNANAARPEGGPQDDSPPAYR